MVIEDNFLNLVLAISNEISVLFINSNQNLRIYVGLNIRKSAFLIFKKGPQLDARFAINIQICG